MVVPSDHRERGISLAITLPFNPFRITSLQDLKNNSLKIKSLQKNRGGTPPARSYVAFRPPVLELRQIRMSTYVESKPNSGRMCSSGIIELKPRLQSTLTGKTGRGVQKMKILNEFRRVYGQG